MSDNSPALIEGFTNVCGDVNNSIPAFETPEWSIGSPDFPPNDANAAKAAGIPIILLEDGYTEKKITEIHHHHLVKDFVNMEEIVTKYL